MLLRRFTPTPDSASLGGAATLRSPAALLATLLGIARRQLLLIILLVLSGAGVGVAYLAMTPAQFTATALLLLDSRRTATNTDPLSRVDGGFDPARVESQVQLLRTDTIALSVIKDLHLTEEPEFACGGRSGIVGVLLGPLMHLVADEKPCSEFEITQTAVGAFAHRLAVRRVGLSYVLEISFTSHDPERAAQIANAVADAYVRDQMDARYQVIKRASSWLQDRLRELGDQSSSAQRAVVEFKTKNDIVDANGRLTNDQQLTELNTQLVAARTQASDAKAKLDRIEALLRSDKPSDTVDATVTDALHSEVINRLRSQYLDTQRRVNEWTQRYGGQHLAVKQARAEMQEIRGSILDELRRLAETYKSDYDIARRKVGGIQAELSRAVTETQLTNQAQVALRELESNAQTSRSLYDNFLQRYMDSVQQQSFPITEARVIAAASPPLRKSRPRTMLVLALSLGGGAVLALGAGILRDSWHPVFRSIAELEEFLQVRCLAVLPLLNGAKASAAPAKPAKRARSMFWSRDAAVPKEPPRTIKRGTGPLWHVANVPMSPFTEAIRSIKLAVDLSRSGGQTRVIGVTSASPYEGKSTLAGALGLLMAQTNATTVVVDGDLRNPFLTRTLAPDAQQGFLDVVLEKARLDDVIWTDPTCALAFVPGVINQRVSHTTEILASSQATALIETLRERYDNVVIDLSPLTPVVDVRATRQLVDAYVLVVEWGQTRVDLINHALRDAPGLCDNMLGVVLNKAPRGEAVVGRRTRSSGNYYYGDSDKCA